MTPLVIIQESHAFQFKLKFRGMLGLKISQIKIYTAFEFTIFRLMSCDLGKSIF